MMTLGGRVSIFGWQTRSHLPDTHLSHIGQKLWYPANSKIQLYTHSLSKSDLPIGRKVMISTKQSNPTIHSQNQTYILFLYTLVPNWRKVIISCKQSNPAVDLMAHHSQNQTYFFRFLAWTEQIGLSHILLFLCFHDSIFEHSKAMGVWYFIGWL